MDKNNQLADFIKEIEEFRTARNWKQFHNLKDMLISLNLESAELLELIQWKTSEEFLEEVEKDQTSVADELADIFYWLLIISKDLNIDLAQAFKDKMKKNKLKYPVEKSFNNKSKYSNLPE